MSEAKDGVPRTCGKCGMRVSAGACDVPPLVFHDRFDDCVVALKAELARVQSEVDALEAKVCACIHDGDTVQSGCMMHERWRAASQPPQQPTPVASLGDPKCPECRGLGYVAVIYEGQPQIARCGECADGLVDPPEAGGRTDGCTCAAIQVADPTRHFKGCPERVEKAEPVARDPKFGPYCPACGCGMGAHRVAYHGAPITCKPAPVVGERKHSEDCGIYYGSPATGGRYPCTCGATPSNPTEAISPGLAAELYPEPTHPHPPPTEKGEGAPEKSPEPPEPESAWLDVRDEWSEAIKAAHPLRTGLHDQYGIAMRMVSNRHSKGALVELVNWLLSGSPRLDHDARRQGKAR